MQSDLLLHSEQRSATKTATLKFAKDSNVPSKITREERNRDT